MKPLYSPAPTSGLTIERLSLHLGLMPVVASWLRSEWPAWYGPEGAGDADADLLRYAQAGAGIPLGMVALRDGQPCGFGALKADGMPPGTLLGPWAGAGYVPPALRGQGLGALLLRALVREAAVLGFERVHCATRSANTLLLREGWQALERVQHGDETLTVFRSAA